MSLSVGNIYEATFVQRLFGQLVLNVQFYRCESAELEATENIFAQRLWNEWVANVLIDAASAIELTGVTIKDVSDGVSIGSYSATPVPGVIALECMPAFVTWALRQNRQTALTRHGHKLLAGVPEASVINGVTVPGAPTLARWQQMFGNNMTSPGATGPDTGYNMQPVIVGRTPSLTAPGSYVLDLTKINGIAGVSFRKVSTANSRKTR